MNITIRRPFDGHLHLRRGDILRRVFCHSAKDFSAGVIMSNTVPPVDAGSLDSYREEVMTAAISYASSRKSHEIFQPVMTIQCMESTTPQEVETAWKLGAKAMKIYPRGMTSNSEWGVQDYVRIYPALKTAQEVGMLALFHPEFPDEKLFCLDREKAFLRTFMDIIGEFPLLRAVWEHVTTSDAVAYVRSCHYMGRNVAATITSHHLVLTLNDVIGGKLRPHNFCKPIAKREEDRLSIVNAAVSGEPCFFFGSDSAPWLRGQKECGDGCAGIFNAPVALPVVAGVFEEQNALDRLEAFVSINGPSFYGLAPADATLTLSKEPWQVPAEYGGIVPFRAGEKLEWQVVD